VLLNGLHRKAVVLVLSGFLLLRISGRKSISQLTIPTTIVMISIGTIIVQPIIDQSMVKTIVTIALFVGILIIIEFLQVKVNLFERLFTGKSKIIIQNGQIVSKTLKEFRLTVDKIEMQLRQSGISSISDVKNATIEPNGKLGYELMPDAKPLTVGEFKNLMAAFINQNPTITSDGDLFYEVKNKEHQIPHPDQLN
jgi:uncharacterized membrane protein YcaP (DUF421 family)